MYVLAVENNNDFWYCSQKVIKIPPTSEGIFKEAIYVILFGKLHLIIIWNSDNVPTCPVKNISYELSAILS